MVREDRLCEFVVLDDSTRAVVGEILLGRIAKIDRGLEAAFVECAQGRTGFLPLRDAPSGVTEGQRLILQVGRAPVDGKAMRLTARPMLSGYRLSFAPFAKGVLFPDDVTAFEKARLQRTIELLGQAARGLCLRRQAIDAKATALRAEAESLKAAWAEIKQRAAADAPQPLLPAPDPLAELLRQNGASIKEIICDTRAATTQLAELVRVLDEALAEKVRFQPRRDWVPSVAELEEQIDEALGEEVALLSGAMLHFAETRAMTVVDVDSGTARLEGVGAKAERSFLSINIDAAKEIARQIRLRNLAGVIVIDFIDMRRRQSLQEVADTMRAATAGDPHPVWVGGISKLGLLELTRQRRGPTLATLLLRDCKSCGGRHRVPRDEMRPWIGNGI